MLAVSRVIPESVKHVLDPVGKQVLYKIIDDIGISADFTDAISYRVNHTAPTRSTNADNQPILSSDPSIVCQAEYVTNPRNIEWIRPFHNVAGGLPSRTRAGDKLPVLLDTDANVNLTEHNTPANINLEIRFSTPKRDLAYRIQDALSIKYTFGDMTLINNVHYNYPIPNHIAVCLLTIAQLRGIPNAAFIRYLQQYSGNAIGRLSNLEKSTRGEFVVRRTIRDLPAVMTMAGDAPEVLKDNQQAQMYVVTCSVKLQLDRPQIMLIEYPPVVNNTLVPEYMVQLNPALVQDVPDPRRYDFCFDDFYLDLQSYYDSEIPLVHLPWYDTWYPKNVVPLKNAGFVPVLSVLCTLDDTDNDEGVTEVDLSTMGGVPDGETPTINLTAEVAEAISEAGEAVFYFGGDYHVAVFANEELVEPTTLSLDGTTLTIPNRNTDKVYRIVVSASVVTYTPTLTWNRVMKFDIIAERADGAGTTVDTTLPVAPQAESHVPDPQVGFTTVWDIPDGGLEIVLPFSTAGTYDVSIDWGDGDTSSGGTANEPAWYTHTFENDTGSTIQRTVEVTGTASHLTSAQLTNEAKAALVEVPELGDLGWTNFNTGFANCGNLTTVAGGVTTAVTDMSSMFYRCYLATPDTSLWDTSSCTDMSAMFNDARVAEPDTSNWDTSNVTSFGGTFSNARAANPDVTDWDTGACTDISYMFRNAYLATPDTSNWDTSNVTFMHYVFTSCALATPDTSAWDTSKVTTMQYMFNGATSANPDTSNWSTSNVTNMAGMFYNADSATPDTSEWDTSSVTDMGSMFDGATVANPDVSGWDVSGVTDMGSMFNNAALANPDTSLWDTSACTDMGNMFSRAYAVASDVSGFNTSLVENMRYMFRQVTYSPDVSSFDMSSVTDIRYMFDNATSANPDVSAWDLSSCTSASFAFHGCTSMTTEVPAEQFWKNINITDFGYCFNGAANIENYESIPDTWITSGGAMIVTFETTDVDQLTFLNFTTAGEYCCFVDWGDGTETSGDDPTDTSWYSHTFATPGQHTVTINGYATHLSYFDYTQEYRDLLIAVNNLGGMGYTNLDYAWYMCTNLVEFNGSNTSQVTSMLGTFYGATDVEPEVSTWDTAKVTNMANMFRGCEAADPDVSSWDVSKVTNFAGMFYSVTVAQPDVTLWDTGSATSFNYMFALSSSIDPDVSLWDTGDVTDMAGMFKECAAATPDVSDWLTTSCTNMSYMFCRCYLATPSTGDWDTSSVTDMSHMFESALLADPDVSSWDVGNVTHMYAMFFQTTSADPDVSGWDVSNVVALSRMFRDATVANPDVSNWDVSSCTSFSEMFLRATSANPDVSGWDVSGGTNMVSMFQGATIATPDTSNWDVSNVINMYDMFNGALAANPDISLWDLGNCVSADRAFKNCPSMTNAVPAAQLWQNVSIASFAACCSDSPSISNLSDIPGTWKGDSCLSLEFTVGDGESVELPVNSVGACACHVDWDDGSDIQHGSNTSDTSWWQHTYTTGGTYTVSVDGWLPGLCYDGTDIAKRNRLTAVPELGSMGYLTFDYAFLNCENLTSVAGGTTTGATNMKYMFNGCTSLVTLDVSHYDTSSVEEMVSMFRDSVCNPDVSSWDVSNVTTFRAMFMNNATATPNTASWITTALTDCSHMFRDATSANPNVTNWDVSKVTIMEYMFSGCDSIDPDVSNWDTGSCTNMNHMFYYAEAANPNVTDWNVSGVTTMANMFQRAFAATPNTSNWVTTSLTNTSNMFYQATSADPDVSGWDMSGVTDMDAMFRECDADPDVSGWDVSSVVNCRVMFYNNNTCNPDISSWVLSSCTTCDYAFYGCVSMTTTIPADQFWKNINITDFGYCFNGAANIENYESIPGTWTGGNALQLTYNITSAPTTILLPFDASVADAHYCCQVDWNGEGATNGDDSNMSWASFEFTTTGEKTVTVDGYATALTSLSLDATSRDALIVVPELGDTGWINFNSAFYYCGNLTNVIGGDTSGVNDMSYMFYEAIDATPDTSGWDTSNVTSMVNMFRSATSANPATAGWNTSKTTSFNYMFRYASVANPDVSGWDTSAVTSMAGMFQGTAAANPDVSGWDTSKVEFFSSMFWSSTLANPDTSLWDTSSCTNMVYMFRGCHAADPDVSNWDVSKVTNIAGMFLSASVANPDISSWELDVCANASEAFRNCTSMTHAVPKEQLWHNTNVSVFTDAFAGSISISNYNDIPGTWKGGDGFVITYSVGAGDTVVLPFDETLDEATSEYCCFVDWGDGTETSGDESDMSWAQHTFAGAGTKTVTVTGYATHLSHLNSIATIRDYVNTVPELGALGYTSLAYAFYYCTNLTTVLGGDVGNSTTMRAMFSGATNAVPTTSSWDTSSCSDFYYMFRNAETANPDVSGWDTSNVTSMRSMFDGAEAANPDTSNWNTSNVTSMQLMFQSAISANPDVSGWDVSSVESFYGAFRYTASLTTANMDTSNWDTSSCTNMYYMFGDSTSNFTLDVSGWDMRKVTIIKWMFTNCTTVNPDISNWELDACTNCQTAFHRCTSMTSTVPADQFWNRVTPAWESHVTCFAGATSIANYSSIPADWK